jgi:hypothetical protein
MRGKKKRPAQMNLFQARLDQIIDADHELIQLAQALDPTFRTPKWNSPHPWFTKATSALFLSLD